MAKPKQNTIRAWQDEVMAIADLKPSGYNPRKISGDAMKAVKASLAQFGELGGIVWNRRTGRLVGGHQRVKALADLGVQEARVRVVDLDEAEEKAANVALNHRGIGGEWDADMLPFVLEDIRVAAPIVFDELNLSALIESCASDIEPGEGEMPDLPDAPPDAPKVSFALSLEQISIVEAALDRAGGNRGTNIRAESLVRICHAFRT